MRDFRNQRHAMVQRHIVARGVRSPLVLDAMRTVPREEFLPAHLREDAKSLAVTLARREVEPGDVAREPDARREDDIGVLAARGEPIEYLTPLFSPSL